MDGAAALKCNGYRFKSLLGRSVLCGRVNTEDANLFKFVIETDQLERTKSRMFNMSLKLTNHKCLLAK